MYQFQKLREDQIILMHYWLNQKFIANNWDGRCSLRDVRERYFKKIKSDIVFPYIVYLDNYSIGYIQSYKAWLCGDGWWTDEKEATWGLDTFIGERNYIKRGHGAKFIKQFVEEILIYREQASKIIIDPSPENKRAIRAYEKVGFEQQEIVNTPDGKALYMVYKSKQQ